MDGHHVNAMNTGLNLKTNEQFHSKTTTATFFYNLSFYRNERKEVTVRRRLRKSLCEWAVTPTSVSLALYFSDSAITFGRILGSVVMLHSSQDGRSRRMLSVYPTTREVSG